VKFLSSSENKMIFPYAKAAVGLSVALAMAVSENQLIRNIGVGIGIASFLQLLDVKK
jgi:predicted TIM-barrel enzyme